MAKVIRIYQTPGPLRAIGSFFLVTGLLTVAVVGIRIVRGELPISDAAIGLIVGNAFAVAGWAVFASDSITFCEHSREVVFYKQMFRSIETHRAVLNHAATLEIVEDPSDPHCYCLKLDEYIVKDSISKAQANRLKNRIAKILLI